MPAPLVLIRPAAPGDALAFASVICAAQSSWAEWAGPEFHPYEVSELEAQWGPRLADPNTAAFVATVDDGVVVAVAAAGPEASSYEPSLVDAGSAHLSTLFADPSFHGGGVAQAVHDVLLGDLRGRGFTTVRLWVPDGAGRARGFYGRNLWVDTGREIMFAGLLRLEMRRPL